MGGVPYSGVLFFVRILLYEGALFSETPMCWHMWPCLRLDHVEFRLESLGLRWGKVGFLGFKDLVEGCGHMVSWVISKAIYHAWWYLYPNLPRSLN